MGEQCFTHILYNAGIQRNDGAHFFLSLEVDEMCRCECFWTVHHWRSCHAGELQPVCEWEYPDQLYPSLVWELLSCWQQSTAGGKNRPNASQGPHFLPLRTSRWKTIYVRLTALTLFTLYNLLPPGRCFRSLWTRTSRLRNTFSLQLSPNSLHFPTPLLPPTTGQFCTRCTEKSMHFLNFHCISVLWSLICYLYISICKLCS